MKRESNKGFVEKRWGVSQGTPPAGERNGKGLVMDDLRTWCQVYLNMHPATERFTQVYETAPRRRTGFVEKCFA